MTAIAHVRTTVKKGIAELPPIFRPGLLRESLYMAGTLKNWREWVGALYGRDSAPRRALFRNGMLLEASERDSLLFLVAEIMAERSYTPRWFYRPGSQDVVIDIGANIGVFALHICGLSPGARVTCFEPDPVSYGTLAQNIAASGLTGRVQVYQAAVWRNEGVVYLALPSTGSSIIQKVVARSEDGLRPVKCVSLTRALQEADPAGAPVALLKIDAEGAETDILEGADPAAMQRVQRVALEYHGPEKRQACAEILKRHGFHLRQGKDEGRCGILYASRKGVRRPEHRFP